MSPETPLSRQAVRYLGIGVASAGFIGLLGTGAAYLNVASTPRACMTQAAPDNCAVGYTYRSGMEHVEQFVVGSAIVTIAGLSMALVPLESGSSSGPKDGGEPLPANTEDVVDLADRRGPELPIPVIEALQPNTSEQAA